MPGFRRKAWKALLAINQFEGVSEISIVIGGRELPKFFRRGNNVQKRKSRASQGDPAFRGNQGRPALQGCAGRRLFQQRLLSRSGSGSGRLRGRRGSRSGGRSSASAARSNRGTASRLATASLFTTAAFTKTCEQALAAAARFVAAGRFRSAAASLLATATVTQTAEQAATATAIRAIRTAATTITTTVATAATMATVTGDGHVLFTAHEGDTDDREENRDTKTKNTIHSKLLQLKTGTYHAKSICRLLPASRFATAKHSGA